MKTSNGAPAKALFDLAWCDGSLLNKDKGSSNEVNNNSREENKDPAHGEKKTEDLEVVPFIKPE